VLIDDLSAHFGVSVTVYPVHTAGDFDSSGQDESIFDRVLRPTLVPIVSRDEAESPANNAICLRSNRTLHIQEPIFQNVYSSSMFAVGSLMGPPSDAVCLDSSSRKAFVEAASAAHETINDEYPKALALSGGVDTKGTMACGCHGGLHPRLPRDYNTFFTMLSDIVVDVAHKASLDEKYQLTGGLSLQAEIDRTLQIAEVFAQWLPYHQFQIIDSRL
jgi:hypothetical protein